MVKYQGRSHYYCQDINNNSSNRQKIIGTEQMIWYKKLKKFEFSLLYSDVQMNIWYRPSEEFNEDCIQDTKVHDGYNVTVWKYNCGKEKCILVLIKRILCHRFISKMINREIICMEITAIYIQVQEFSEKIVYTPHKSITYMHYCYM